MEPPAGGGTRDRSRTRCAACSARCPTPTRRTTCAGSTRATARSTGVAAGLDDRDLRRDAAGDRQLALVGGAVLHPHRQAPAGHADRGAARLPRPAAAGFAAQGRRPEPEQLIIKLDPSTGIRLLVDAQRGEAVEPEQIRMDMDFAGRAARGRRRTRCCCTPRCGATARFTRQDSVEEAWRILQPLLDSPPPVHPYARARGGRPRPTSSSPATAAGTSPWVAA